MTDDVERSEAEKERAAIVAWLRDETDKAFRMSDAAKSETMRRFHRVRAMDKNGIANAIERGDHLQETAND